METQRKREPPKYQKHVISWLEIDSWYCKTRTDLKQAVENIGCQHNTVLTVLNLIAVNWGML